MFDNFSSVINLYCGKAFAQYKEFQWFYWSVWKFQLKIFGRSNYFQILNFFNL